MQQLPILVAAVLALTAFPASPARAEVRPPDGLVCEWNGVEVPTGGWLHEFSAGPLTLVDDDPGANPAFGTVTCSLVDGWSHTSPVLASATSSPLPGAAVLPPTVVPGGAVPGDRAVNICTRVDVVGGPTFYFDGGVWQTVPGSCNTARPQEVPPRPVRELLDLVWAIVEAADETVCPRLASLGPGAGPVTIEPEGDTSIDGELFWDCPPYEV